MSPRDVITEKEAILQRLEAARLRADTEEVRRCLGELLYLMRVEADARLKQTRLDWLDQQRIIVADARAVNAAGCRP